MDGIGVQTSRVQTRLHVVAPTTGLSSLGGDVAVPSFSSQLDSYLSHEQIFFSVERACVYNSLFRNMSDKRRYHGCTPPREGLNDEKDHKQVTIRIVHFILLSWWGWSL